MRTKRIAALLAMAAALSAVTPAAAGAQTSASVACVTVLPIPLC